MTIGVALTLLFALIFEFFRLRYNLLSGIVREYEKDRICAYIYFGVAVLLITLLFPMDAAFSAVLVTLLGDGLGGIVKRLVMVWFHLPFSCVSGAIVKGLRKVRGLLPSGQLLCPHKLPHSFTTQ